ncbi:hypothetical protein CRG98_041264 [Punica granatum]|uniref:RAB6-interacting golgin n=1 Tax=Punica granatum TaxID=22663 RepID=A0A2I0I3D7_PUNGR|nr:hypothetical protein CRG98_041264 [Punica granatum]
MARNPSLQPEIGPDGLPREAPVIAYTEKRELAFHIPLLISFRYIQENYSKIRDVERELANLSMEMKLTAGPKKAALELLRKKIQASTERIRVAKQKEEQAQKAWEAASKVVKEEEALKQKLCEDLSNLVQESSNCQYSRLEELKRRLAALNPMQSVESGTSQGASSVPRMSEASGITENTDKKGSSGDSRATNRQNQESPIEGEGRAKNKIQFHGRGKGIGAVPKGKNSGPGWTGAGFDVDGRT